MKVRSLSECGEQRKLLQGGSTIVTDGYEKNRGIQRYRFATPRTCSLSVISFNNLMRTDFIVRILDISIIGLGIASNEKIEPGLVWFKKRVGGHRCGVIEWVGESEGSYRAGIRFVTLPKGDESLFQEQLHSLPPHGPLHDPQKIIASIVEPYRKE